MAFPAALTNAVDGVTEIIAAHLNDLEAKVGIDGSAVPTSLDYLVKNAGSINPGHKHSKLWASDGDPEAVTVDAAGNVGIGTTSPSQKLHISLDPDYRIFIDRNISADTAGTRIVARLKNDANDAYIECVGIIFRKRSGNKGDLLFMVNTSTGLSTAMYLDPNCNIGIGGITTLGTNAAKVLGISTGTAPTTAPADMAQMWVEDVNAAAGKAGLHMMAESGTGKLIVAGVLIKGTTGDPSQVHEGLMCINTVDNTLKMYADGGWRQLASWT